MWLCFAAAGRARVRHNKSRAMLDVHRDAEARCRYGRMRIEQRDGVFAGTIHVRRTIVCMCHFANNVVGSTQFQQR